MGEQIERRIVVACVGDLFFLAKIEAAAGHAGVTLMPAMNTAQLSEHLASVVPDLVIVDLSNNVMPPLEVIRRIKSDRRLDRTTIVGFCSHVLKELKQEAERAGCDHVLSRSTFTENLSRILLLGSA